MIIENGIYSLDDEGRVRKITDQWGSVRHLDDDARLVWTDFADTQNMAYARDDNGRAVSSTRSDGLIEFYDQRGLVTRRENASGQAVNFRLSINFFGCGRMEHRDDQGTLIGEPLTDGDQGVPYADYGLAGLDDWPDDGDDEKGEGEPDTFFEDETSSGEVIRRVVFKGGEFVRTPNPAHVVSRKVFREGKLASTYTYNEEGWLISRTDANGFVTTVGDYTYAETDEYLPNGTEYTWIKTQSDDVIALRTPDGSLWMHDDPAFPLVELGMYEWGKTLTEQELNVALALIQGDEDFAFHQKARRSAVITDTQRWAASEQAVDAIKRNPATYEAQLREKVAAILAPPAL